MILSIYVMSCYDEAVKTHQDVKICWNPVRGHSEAIMLCQNSLTLCCTHLLTFSVSFRLIDLLAATLSILDPGVLSSGGRENRNSIVVSCLYDRIDSRLLDSLYSCLTVFPWNMVDTKNPSLFQCDIVGKLMESSNHVDVDLKIEFLLEVLENSI